jgi:hypothetical protein
MRIAGPSPQIGGNFDPQATGPLCARRRPDQEHLPRRDHAHIRGRRGLPKAVGATRHDLLIAYWHVVHGQVDYADLGHDWAPRRHSTEHRTRRLVHQLEQLGHTVTLEPSG